MDSPFEDQDADFMVLMNQLGQYSLWPSFHAVPPGWAAIGPTGARQDCLAWIETHWTALQPRSARAAQPTD